ncbi:thymidylate synthase [Haemophilus influenzae]|uniref:Thymidylate synthase n=1 Tax=Haemophilus influenzae TaxID=727 RepID=A0AAX3IRE0_HAEIF|nr:thymidylate synthase [Haemophilus influenzae]RFN96333.1 thymidylate synthase [Haemophilus influenzae]VTX58794.1 Thymidylate synthase [Haemophilus influenzae]
MLETHNISADNIDDLVSKGCSLILNEGIDISSRAGKAKQCYNVNYTLINPRNRVHSLRKQAKGYLCKELLAYFKGSLDVSEGLGQASKFWYSLANENGKINSNYGYYVFYEKIDYCSSQYHWVLNSFKKNKDTRRAIININQAYHKSDTKDFPCTTAILFFIKENKLFCNVFSRSTDVITGLPYDMGFFSFLHELLFQDLVEEGISDLELGSTTMKTSFTQIYEKTLNKALGIVNNHKGEKENMPVISNAKQTLLDIYNRTSNTKVMKWIIENAR